MPGPYWENASRHALCETPSGSNLRAGYGPGEIAAIE
jgi:hypothetical protein